MLSLYVPEHQQPACKKAVSRYCVRSTLNGRTALNHLSCAAFSNSVYQLTVSDYLLYLVFFVCMCNLCVTTSIAPCINQSGFFEISLSTYIGHSFAFGITEEKRRGVLNIMLLRNRSRAVTKPPLMADHTSSSQPSTNQTNARRTVPSLFGSPKFRDFTNKCLSGTEALRSPTSILDTKALSPFGFGNPFSYANNTSRNRTSMDHKIEPKSIGLALVGALEDDPFYENSAEPNKGNVLFGTQLRVKIPSFESHSQTCADHDFGTKTKDSQNSGIYYTKDNSPREVVEGILSLSEMELSEEYTCVIAHGPNPRTTHIFNNCIVESSCSVPQNSHYASGNFLSFCYTCKKHLDQTKDIFIYRGEKGFCSRECRYREMVLDGVENCEFDSNGQYS